MNPVKSNRYSFHLLLLVLAMLLGLNIFSGCSNGTGLSQEVCDIGEVVCEVSQQLCQTLPVPEEVCYYVNIACINLQLLCTNEPESTEYKAAVTNLRKINEQLEKYVQGQKIEKVPLDSLQ